jgi:hypothetical protein
MSTHGTKRSSSSTAQIDKRRKEDSISGVQQAASETAPLAPASAAPLAPASAAPLAPASAAPLTPLASAAPLAPLASASASDASDRKSELSSRMTEADVAAASDKIRKSLADIFGENKSDQIEDARIKTAAMRYVVRDTIATVANLIFHTEEPTTSDYSVCRRAKRNQLRGSSE